MDLLGQEINNKKDSTSKKKKMVLISLIFCIIMLVILLAVISVLSKEQKPVSQKLIIDNTEVQLTEGLIVADEGGNKYISLESGAELIGYKFFNGEYGKNEEDKDKCYLQSSDEVIGFELDSNEVYKIVLDNNIEAQIYTIDKNIIKYNDKLYIAINDFSKSCNLTMSNDGGNINLKSNKFLSEEYLATIKEQNKYTSISNEYENLKAIYYGMLVVNDGKNYGVVDLNMSTIIGAKYSNIIFDEYTQNFIATSNNKCGVLSKKGTVEIDFKYDSIRIIKYSPLLYEVKQNNKYGVLDEDGNIIINTEYDKLGYNSTSNDIGSVLIIEDIDNKEDGMVVCKNGKYGIINIKTGKVILNCELQRIYSKTSEDDEITYYVQTENQEEYLLEKYINDINTTVVNLQN